MVSDSNVSLASKLSQTGSERNIDQELARARTSQQERRWNLFTTRGTLARRLERRWCSDHNTLRVTLLMVSLLSSYFASVLLVIVGDPPHNQGQLFQHTDLMRLLTQIHRNRVYITANFTSDHHASFRNHYYYGPESEVDSVNANATLDDPRIRRYMHEAWPVNEIQLGSSNAVLDDANYYWSNYAAYQTAFLTFILLANLLLVIIWPCFRFAKYLIKHNHTLKSWIRNLCSRENYRCMKQCWNESEWCPSTSLQVSLIVVILHLTLLLVLLLRPNLLAIVFHQTSFTCLTVWCLATTRLPVRRVVPPMSKNGTIFTTTSRTSSKNANSPKSLKTRIDLNSYPVESNPFENETDTVQTSRNGIMEPIDEADEREVERV